MALATLTDMVGIARALDDQNLLSYGLGHSVIAADLTDAPNLWDVAQEALTVSRSVGDKNILGMVQMLMSAINDPRNTDANKRACKEEALRFVNESRSPLAYSMTIFTLVIYARVAGDWQTARQYLMEAHRIFIDIDDHYFDVIVQSELAHLSRVSGDLASASAAYQQTLRSWKDIGNRPAIANQLECMAFIARAQGQLIGAARLLGAAEALREQVGTPMAFYERAEYAQEVSALQAQMDAAAFALEWAHGRALPMDDAIQYALNEIPVNWRAQEYKDGNAPTTYNAADAAPLYDG